MHFLYSFISFAIVEALSRDMWGYCLGKRDTLSCRLKEVLVTVRSLLLLIYHIENDSKPQIPRVAYIIDS